MCGFLVFYFNVGWLCQSKHSFIHHSFQSCLVTIRVSNVSCFMFSCILPYALWYYYNCENELAIHEPRTNQLHSFTVKMMSETEEILIIEEDAADDNDDEREKDKTEKNNKNWRSRTAAALLRRRLYLEAQNEARRVEALRIKELEEENIVFKHEHIEL